MPLIVVDAGTEAPNPLPDLPRLPDEPRSLFAPPPPPGPPGPPLPGPYFEDDPRLDPPILPLPGWFADVETEIAVAHVKNKLVNTVSAGGAAPNTVALPSAELDWTVAPRFELGYRLPSGFGAFALAYRFLTTEGTQGTIGADGPASLHSRLELNEIDFDYVSREFSLWPLWEMQWRFGGRLTELFFDSRADEPFAAAAAGSGIFESRDANGYVGFGPHWGVQLVRQLDASGFSLVGAVERRLPSRATPAGLLRSIDHGRSNRPAAPGRDPHFDLASRSHAEHTSRNWLEAPCLPPASILPGLRIRVLVECRPRQPYHFARRTVRPGNLPPRPTQLLTRRSGFPA